MQTHEQINFSPSRPEPTKRRRDKLDEISKVKKGPKNPWGYQYDLM